MILLNDGWMVDLAMGSFRLLIIFLIFWHHWDPWICISSVCWKWNLKQIEAIPPSVHVGVNLTSEYENKLKFQSKAKIVDTFEYKIEIIILQVLKILTIVIAIIEKIGICSLTDVYNILLISETIIEIWTSTMQHYMSFYPKKKKLEYRNISMSEHFLTIITQPFHFLSGYSPCFMRYQTNLPALLRFASF